MNNDRFDENLPLPNDWYREVEFPGLVYGELCTGESDEEFAHCSFCGMYKTYYTKAESLYICPTWELACEQHIEMYNDVHKQIGLY